MVKESELVEGLRERAKLIVEHELLFPWRQTYARYLHVAEAVAEDEVQAAWDGLGGRLKALRREVVVGQAKAEVVAEAGQVKVKADMSEVKTDVSDMKAEVSEVKADVSEVKADVSEVKAEVLKVKADVSEVKALLEKLVAQSLQNAA
jgi:chromosome segregation ATPase